MAITPTPPPPPITLNIAILDCITPIPSVIQSRGSISKIFLDLFQSAANRFSTYRFPDGKKIINIKGETFNVVKDEYPDCLEGFDAVLITGSFASAYDEIPWVLKLVDYIRDIYTNHPTLKIFGSCFGHQIIAQSLLTPYGGHVERNPAGLEIGLQNIVLSPDFISHFPYQLTPNTTLTKTSLTNSPTTYPSLTLQFIHADHVVLPPSIPSPTSPTTTPPFINIGSTPLCPIQGLYLPNRILTLQGHLEFDAWINKECIAAIAKLDGWEEEKLNRGLEMVEGRDDAGVWGEVVVEFLVGGGVV